MTLYTKIILIILVSCLLFPVTIFAAILYSGSASQIVYKGQTFVVDWYLDTEGAAVNTVDLKISFTKDVLRVVEAVPGSSLVSLWMVTPQFDNDKGQVVLTGGIPNGVNASGVPIFRTTFEAVGEGPAKISLEQGSQILRNDGQGTAEVLKFRPLEFPVVSANLQPNVITSNTHPDQTKWYNDNDVTIRYDRKDGVDYSYSFSSNSEIYPDELAETLGEVSYLDMPDGLYYFKLNSKVGPSNWQEAAVYRVQIDSTPPAEFQMVMGSDSAIYDGKDFLSFSTVDKTSGMSHYKARLGNIGVWKNITSPMKLNKFFIGNTISVEAYDLAGNKTVAQIEYKSLIPIWAWLVMVLAVLGSLFGVLRKKKLF